MASYVLRLYDKYMVRYGDKENSEFSKFKAENSAFPKFITRARLLLGIGDVTILGQILWRGFQWVVVNLKAGWDKVLGHWIRSASGAAASFALFAPVTCLPLPVSSPASLLALVLPSSLSRWSGFLSTAVSFYH